MILLRIQAKNWSVTKKANAVIARLAELQADVFDKASGFDLGTILQQVHAGLHPGQHEFVSDSSTEILGTSAGYSTGKVRALCWGVYAVLHCHGWNSEQGCWISLHIIYQSRHQSQSRSAQPEVTEGSRLDSKCNTNPVVPPLITSKSMPWQAGRIWPRSKAT